LLLLDKWAADQDPEFRRKFYYDLLRGVKRSGETGVAITQDDRYIDEMDAPARRLRREDARIAAQQTVGERGSKRICGQMGSRPRRRDEPGGGGSPNAISRV